MSQDQDYLDTESAKRVLRRLRKTLRIIAYTAISAVLVTGAWVGYRQGVLYSHKLARDIITWELGNIDVAYKVVTCESGKNKGANIPVWAGDEDLTLEQAKGLIAQLAQELRLQALIAREVHDTNKRAIEQLEATGW